MNNEIDKPLYTPLTDQQIKAANDKKDAAFESLVDNLDEYIEVSPSDIPDKYIDWDYRSDYIKDVEIRKGVQLHWHQSPTSDYMMCLVTDEASKTQAYYDWWTDLII